MTRCARSGRSLFAARRGLWKRYVRFDLIFCFAGKTALNAAMTHYQFPHPDLVHALLPHAFNTRDGAHDEAHEELTETEVQVLAFVKTQPKSRPEIAGHLGVKSRSDVEAVTGKVDIAVVGSETIRVVEQQGVGAVGTFIRGLR